MPRQKRDVPHEEINKFVLVFPSLSVNEGAARAAAGAFIAQMDPTAGELADLKCAISEAVTNCIVHAYRDRLGRIRMTVHLYRDRSVLIEIKDNGSGIADVEKAREPLFTTDADGERSGMGFTVMETLTDRLTVISSPGRGTTVKLLKRLNERGRR